MDILIVRHGLAGKADPAEWPDDDLRPLTAKGRKAFFKAAGALPSAGASPSLIFASPALRTLETARILAKALGLKRKAIVGLPALHHSASPRSVLAALRSMDPPPSFALVGHEPNLGRLASLLVAGDTRAALPMAKGGACLVEAPSPEPGSGRLLWSLTQDQLKALAAR